MLPGPSRLPPGSIGGPLAPRLPSPIAARPKPVTLVTLEMRIIDAASGQVLRTVTVTRPAGANVAELVADSPEVSDALIRAIGPRESEDHANRGRELGRPAMKLLITLCLSPLAALAFSVAICGALIVSLADELHQQLWHSK